MDKDLKDWTFQELVNYNAEQIIRELMVGNFRQGVFTATELAARWRRAQDEAEKPKKKPA